MVRRKRIGRKEIDTRGMKVRSGRLRGVGPGLLGRETGRSGGHSLFRGGLGYTEKKGPERGERNKGNDQGPSPDDGTVGVLVRHRSGLGDETSLHWYHLLSTDSVGHCRKGVP